MNNKQSMNVKVKYLFQCRYVACDVLHCDWVLNS